MKAALPLLASTLALAACVPAATKPATTAAPVPVVRPAPVPPPSQAPLPVVTGDQWMDMPATPGTWRYTRSQSAIGPSSRATFITPDGIEAFAVVCSFGDNMGLARTVRTNRNLQMVIRTETASVSRLVPPDPEGQPFVNAVVRPSDPLLDAMALSKGRFAVEVEGLPTLYLPSHAEVSRVVEDCR